MQTFHWLVSCFFALVHCYVHDYTFAVVSLLCTDLIGSFFCKTGVDGCFIKLTTGAQILAATGRDGNNNIYPIAFAIVGQEDTTKWCWLLHQLKICLGGEVGQFGPYTIMSDRQKVST